MNRRHTDFQSVRQSSQLSDSTDTYNRDSNRLAIHLATILQDHPELASLVESWPKLSEPVRASVVAMINTLVGMNVNPKSG